MAKSLQAKNARTSSCKQHATGEAAYNPLKVGRLFQPLQPSGETPATGAAGVVIVTVVAVVVVVQQRLQ